MDSTEKMIQAIEEFVTERVKSFDKNTNPVEIEVITGLVQALNSVPRTVKLLED